MNEKTCSSKVSTIFPNVWQTISISNYFCFIEDVFLRTVQRSYMVSTCLGFFFSFLCRGCAVIQLGVAVVIYFWNMPKPAWHTEFSKQPSLEQKWIQYPSSHKHGSVKNRSLVFPVTFQIRASFHGTMITGERVGSSCGISNSAPENASKPNVGRTSKPITSLRLKWCRDAVSSLPCSWIGSWMFRWMFQPFIFQQFLQGQKSFLHFLHLLIFHIALFVPL